MRTLGFTRPAGKLPDSVAEAEGLGFKVLAAPSLEIEHGEPSEFERLSSSLDRGIPVIFGSTTAADECSKDFGDGFPGMLEPCFVIAIGPGTADRLSSYGVRVDLVPADHSSYGLVKEVTSRFSSGKVITVRSDSGTDIISDGLRGSGLELLDIAVYKLRAADAGPEMSALLESIGKKELDWMAFTSPMSASSFFDRMRERFGERYLQMMNDDVKVAAIGRPTADMLKSLGREPDLVPSKTTFHDLLQSIRDTYPD
jgi:uroporphyrinogen-III synthase